ncbi:helix-turn-helix domain-containing protein [Saccharopolyspora shandongensis]|uniref:helix-turn-helix domain-containing protein n=1 Tax=Saccharopolyspora shandongensis TaxID=418495 RepID=UPI00340BCF03
MSANDRSPKARALGSALRAAREEQGWGLRQLASQIGCAPGTLSRWETGERMPKRADVKRILTQLDTDPERYDEIIDMTGGGADPRWIAVTLPEHRQQLAALLECERTATEIFQMAPLLIPGPLQTTRYIRAIMTAGGVPADEVETRIAVRIGRRELLTRSTAPRITYIIGEAALRQLVGSADAMVEQLGHILEMSKLDNVDIRVMPFDRSWHPGLDGSFLLIDSDEVSSVVFLETRSSGIFLHNKDDIDNYRVAADTVLNLALNGASSRKLISQICKELEATR